MSDVISGKGKATLEPYELATLRQQLQQVREELEHHYRGYLDLEVRLEAVRLERDSAVQEVKALRSHLGNLQRLLLEERQRKGEGSLLRRELSKLIDRLLLRSAAGASEHNHRLATLMASGFLDPEWYVSEYPDVLNSNIEPALHYDEIGWKEGRNPSHRFNTKWYLDSNPDVAASGMNPLWHFIEHGQAEGRTPRPPR